MKSLLSVFKKEPSMPEASSISDRWRLADLTKDEKEVLEKVTPYTMTSPERIISLTRAVNYIIENKIQGDLVECGVWKGGSAMAMADTLQRCKAVNRDIYLYDTFEGMSEPTLLDQSLDGTPATTLLASSLKEDTNSVWCYSTLEEVQENMKTVKYPIKNIHYIKGKVEETIPKHLPEKIALLRLDTDWYTSTKHELEHLFPRLQRGGILIIDDYGHWEGCRKAVDEYIRANKITLFLSRIDYTGRLAIKM